MMGFSCGERRSLIGCGLQIRVAYNLLRKNFDWVTLFDVRANIRLFTVFVLKQDLLIVRHFCKPATMSYRELRSECSVLSQHITSICVACFR